MNPPELLKACGRIDAAAAALRVFMIGCGAAAEETDKDNVLSRQLALRGIAYTIEQAREVLMDTRGGDDFDSLYLMFFQGLVETAEQALWITLEGINEGPPPPSNADLCELLGIALQFHADGKAVWPAVPQGERSGAVTAVNGGQSVAPAGDRQ